MKVVDFLIRSLHFLNQNFWTILLMRNLVSKRMQYMEILIHQLQ